MKALCAIFERFLLAFFAHVPILCHFLTYYQEYKKFYKYTNYGIS